MSLVLQPVFCLKTVNSFLCWLWFEGGGRKITTSPSRVNPLFCTFYIPDYIYIKNSTTKIHLFIQRRPFLKQSNSAWWKQTELLVGLYFVNKSTNPGVPHGRAHVPDAGPLVRALRLYYSSSDNFWTPFCRPQFSHSPWEQGLVSAGSDETSSSLFQFLYTSLLLHNHLLSVVLRLRRADPPPSCLRSRLTSPDQKHSRSGSWVYFKLSFLPLNKCRVFSRAFMSLHWWVK